MKETQPYQILSPRPTPTDLEGLYQDLISIKQLSPGRLQTYNKVIKHLRGFCATEFGSRNPDLGYFNLRFLMRFRMQLLKSASPGTTDLYINAVIALFHHAEAMEYIDKYPFRNFKVTIPSVLKHAADGLDRKVSKEDLGVIENTAIGGKPKLERARKIFLFQRWTGLAWTDLNHYGFRIKELIRSDSDNRRIIQYNRVKTGEVAIIPYFPETEALLKQLEYNVSPGGYYSYLRHVVAMFKFMNLNTEGLGTHTGRHVFGSEMLELGFTMEAVSRMLGHASIEETQGVYAKVNKDKIFADHERIKKIQSVFQMIPELTQPPNPT